MLRKAYKRFPLIELLVVISIITILFSLLNPALSSAMAKSRGLVCSSNLKGLGNLCHLYSDDYYGYLPSILPLGGNNDDSYYAVRGSLLDYLPPLPERDLLHCPENDPKWGTFSRLTNYGLNSHLLIFASNSGPRAPANYESAKVNAIDDAENILLGADGGRRPAYGSQQFGIRQSMVYTDNDIQFWHENNYYALFADNHTELKNDLSDIVWSEF